MRCFFIKRLEPLKVEAPVVTGELLGHLLISTATFHELGSVAALAGHLDDVLAGFKWAHWVFWMAKHLARMATGDPPLATGVQATLLTDL